MNQLTEFLLDAATSPITFLILAGLIIGDAVIPMLPSESIVVGLSSILVHDHPELLVVLALVAFAAAWVGDNIAYTIGTTHLVRDNRFTRQRQIKAVLDWSREMLYRRGSTIIIVGRFIPIARIAINLMAGAVGFGRKRFMLVVLISSALWSIYNVVIGAFAGQWFQANPILGMAVAIVLGMVLGPAVDWVLRKTILRGSESAKAAQRRAVAESSEDEPSEGETSEDEAPTGAEPGTGSHAAVGTTP